MTKPKRKTNALSVPAALRLHNGLLDELQDWISDLESAVGKLRQTEEHQDAAIAELATRVADLMLTRSTETPEQRAIRERAEETEAQAATDRDEVDRLQGLLDEEHEANRLVWEEFDKSGIDLGPGDHVRHPSERDDAGHAMSTEYRIELRRKPGDAFIVWPGTWSRENRAVAEAMALATEMSVSEIRVVPLTVGPEVWRLKR